MSTKRSEFAKTVGLFGTIFAAIISFAANHSFWWCLLHMSLGWFYVAYRAIWCPW